MKTKLKILMVFSEITPFARTGVVGDVGGALPKALKDMGHDVRVITPQYRITNERKYVLRDVIRLQNIAVPVGKKTLQINVKSAFLPNTKVQVYFIDYKPFFFREGIYQNPKSGSPYADNHKRFTLFSRGVLETLLKLQWQPDVIHCYDWQSGLIPFFLQSEYRDDSFFNKIHSLLTVHHFNSQVLVDSAFIDELDEQGQLKNQIKSILLKGQCNLLHIGLSFADVVNTISHQYAKEVFTHPDYGKAISKVFHSRRDKLHGVENGIDTDVWNPETDTLISRKYTSSTISEKEENKRVLLEKWNLPFVQERPLMVMHLSKDKKELSAVKQIFNEMVKLNVYLLVLGQSDKTLQRYIETTSKKYPDRVGVTFTSNEDEIHQVLAGADMLLFPTRSEPGNLDHLCGLRYGTIPIVKAAGGFIDTVEPINAETGKGTGFIFEKYSDQHVLKAVKKAVKLFQDHRLWNRFAKNGMRKDFSWQSVAKKYIQLYSKCVSQSK
jgi:starch synthase